MNSGDKILELQESEHAIELLAAQREMYTRAKRWNAAWTAICLGVPLMFTFAQIWIELPPKLVAFVAIAVFACGLFTERKADKFAKQAPYIQQEFDSYVYGINFGERRCDPSLTRQLSKIHFGRAGSREKLSGWYTVPLKGVPAGKAIASCQRQNAKWSESLVSRYEAMGIAVAVLAALAIVCMIWDAHASWDNLAFLPAIMEWFYRRWDKASRAKDNARFLTQAFARWRHTHLDDIRRTQQAILEYRLDMLLVPNWFYECFQRRDGEKSSVSCG